MKALLAIMMSLALAGCAHEQFYAAQMAAIQANKEIAAKDADARVEQAKADSKKWDAMTAAANTGNPVALAALGTAVAISEVKGGYMAREPARPVFQVERAKDFFDYAEQTSRVAANFAQAITPAYIAHENAVTQRAGYQRDLFVERYRQDGESQRVAAIQDGSVRLATALKPAPIPQLPTNVYNIAGDAAIDHSTVSKPNCVANGGSTAQGGSTGNTTTGPGGAAAPSGPAGSAVNNC